MRPNWHLLVQGQRWKHQNNVRNNDVIGVWWFFYISIVDFKQVNAGLNWLLAFIYIFR